MCRSSSLNQQDPKQAIFETVQQIKGFLEGISEGFYEDKSIVVLDQCLDTSSIQVLSSVIDATQKYSGFV